MHWEIENHFENDNGRLTVAGIDAGALADSFGTPLYVYNADRIIENFRRIRDAMKKYADREVRVYYAIKANSSIAILKLLSNENAFIDTVSPLEARIALDAGFPKEKILFSGTSVSDDDIEQLIELGVTINIDSFSQLRRLAKRGSFPVSIRWNPGEGIGHHDHVITAGKAVKFGIPENQILEAFREAVSLGLKPIGLHQHIGSGWLNSDVDIFLSSVDNTLNVAREAASIIGDKLDFVDFGGGPGIPYRPNQTEFPLEQYASGIFEHVKNAGDFVNAISIEPGRYIVGDAGIVLTRINTVETKGVPIIGVDAGFTTLIRPAFYGAYHEILNATGLNRNITREFLIAGNLCESSDVFNEDKYTLRAIPDPVEGDVLAILNAGAYGFAMASVYNARPLPAEVLIENGTPRLIRKRGSYTDLIANQIF